MIKTRTKINKIVAWSLMIAWMIFIFYMSNQPADISNSQSDLVVNILKYIGIDIADQYLDLATTIIRKGAHFTEYMILAFLYYNVLKFYLNSKRARILAVILVFLYACTDEYHQTFINGRAGKFKDVLIDTSGGITGSIIIYILNRNIKWISELDK